MINRKIVIIILWALVTFLPLGALPAGARIEALDDNISQDLGIASGDLSDFIENVIKVFLTLVSIIAVVFVIYGGFQYMTSAGDANQAQKAKSIIFYAVVGLLVIGLSWVIVQFVLGAIGVEGEAGNAGDN